jgi:hypothetical protein
MHDKKNGFGIYKYSNGSSWYSEYKDGQINGFCLTLWPKELSPEESKIGFKNDERFAFSTFKDDLGDGPGIRIYNNQSKAVRLACLESSIYQFY